MSKSGLPSDEVAVVGVIDPDAYGTGTETSDWVAAKDFEKIQAVVMVGTLGTSATVDAKLEQATDSSGTGAKDVAGSAITQLTDAGSDDDKQVVINVRGEDLDVANGFDYVRLSVTVGTAASDAGGIVLGHAPRYAPASDNDLASVDEIVTV